MALEPSRDVPAVLDGEVALAPRRAPRRAARRPAPSLLTVVTRRGCARRRVERDRRVGLHVRVDPDYDHVCPPSSAASDGAGTVGGHALAGASWPGSYQVTSATPRFRRRGTKQLTVSPFGRQMRFGSLRRRFRGYLTGSGIPRGRVTLTMRLLGCIERFDPVHLVLDRLDGIPKIHGALCVQPELRRVAEQAREPSAISGLRRRSRSSSFTVWRETPSASARRRRSARSRAGSPHAASRPDGSAGDASSGVGNTHSAHLAFSGSQRSRRRRRRRPRSGSRCATGR